MIFETWMSYSISCQILENKVRVPVSKKKDWVEGTFTFSFLSTIIHKNSSQYWIEKDGVSCISYWQTGLGIVQSCNIVPSLVSSIGESWDSGLYFAPQLPRSFDHFYGAGSPRPPSPQRGVGLGTPLPRGAGRASLVETISLQISKSSPFCFLQSTFPNHQ